MRTIDVTEIERFLDCDSSLIEKVAQAIVNEDLPGIGGAWPWPTGDAPWEIEVRKNARLAARAACKAFLAWKGHEDGNPKS